MDLPLELFVLLLEMLNVRLEVLDDDLVLLLLLNQACALDLFRNKSSDSGVSLH